MNETVYWMLDEAGEPVPAPDAITWGIWFETAERHVLDDRPARGQRVSTVFLGMDHNFGLSEAPVLWETMVFGGLLDEFQVHYTSRAGALVGHAWVVSLVERCRHLPRKTKKALRKWHTRDDDSLRPGERQRLARLLPAPVWTRA